MSNMSVKINANAGRAKVGMSNAGFPSPHLSTAAALMGDIHFSPGQWALGADATDDRFPAPALATPQQSDTSC